MTASANDVGDAPLLSLFVPWRNASARAMEIYAKSVVAKSLATCTPTASVARLSKLTPQARTAHDVLRAVVAGYVDSRRAAALSLSVVC